jgi:hypothetical protein
VERNVVIAIRDMGGILCRSCFGIRQASGLEVIGQQPTERWTRASMGRRRRGGLFALTALAALGFVVTLRRRMTVAEPMVVLALNDVLAVLDIPLVPAALLQLFRFGLKDQHARRTRPPRFAPDAEFMVRSSCS